MTATTRNEAAERLRGYLARRSAESATRQLDEALAAAKAEGAREAVERIRARLPAALREVSLVRDLYDERQTDRAAAEIADIVLDDEEAAR